MVKGAARILKRIWRPQHTFVVHMDIKANITLSATKTLLFKTGTNNILAFLIITGSIYLIGANVYFT